jgi:hypothetical protein
MSKGLSANTQLSHYRIASRLRAEVGVAAFIARLRLTGERQETRDSVLAQKAKR